MILKIITLLRIFNKYLLHLQLQIFFNQLINCSIEITAYDFITLNNHLITSVSYPYIVRKKHLNMNK